MKPLLIVDGYNVIGAWRQAQKKSWSLDESRDRLQRELENHAGYTGQQIVLVFDGYQSEKRTSTIEQYGSVQVVFTKRGQTADSYIERLVAITPKYRQVRVATSDGLEQIQVLSTGAVRLTSRELLLELRTVRNNNHITSPHSTAPVNRSIAGRLDSKTLEILEKMRRE